MKTLSDQELDDLLRDAQAADTTLDARRAHWTPLVPRLRRLLEENGTLRDEAGQRERMAAEETRW